MFIQTSDGSIEDIDGKIIYFSLNRFIRDICQGNCCFICGTSYVDNENRFISNSMKLMSN
jgi:hypothetical protein